MAMSQTFEHDSGEPVSKSLVDSAREKFGLATVAVGAAVPLALNSADTVKVATKALTFVAKNPKIALGIVAVGAVCYGVHRLTQPGTKIKKTDECFEYERSK